MSRVNNILNNSKFIAKQAEINELEKDRKFCKHDQAHCLEVLRIATLLAKREKVVVDKEVLSAIAILHDIGRAEQYKFNIDHNIAGVIIAEQILNEAGFNEELQLILSAIQNHRSGEENALASILHRADKLSRPCYDCMVSEECNWVGADKNKQPFLGDK